MQQPKVSVVVAVYNVSKYIEQCLRTIFSQTLQEVEYIFVDDKSQDDSMEILSRVLQDYPQRQEQVRIIRHDENKGVAETKNDGIKSATGEYLIVIDPDDYVELEMLEAMYQKAKESNADMVVCDYYRFGETWRERDTLVLNGVIENGEKLRDDILNRRVPSFIVVKLFRRTLFEGPDVVWPVGRFAEDVVYSAITAYYAKKIDYVPQPFYHYRSNDSSLTHASNAAKCVANSKGYVANVDILTKFLTEKGVADKYWWGIMIQKLRARNRLLPLVGQKEYRKMWFQTYPELNKLLFWGDKRYHSTYREKAWFIAIKLGLYPAFKRKLRGKYFRPFPEWPVW